jgi:hypothetical protein
LLNQIKSMSIAAVRLVVAKSNGVMPLLSSCFYKIWFMERCLPPWLPLSYK